MAALTVRNLEDETRNELRLRAARRGASMEDEVRSILRAVVDADLSIDQISGRRPQVASENAWTEIQRLREKYGTVDLADPERTEFAGDRAAFDH